MVLIETHKIPKKKKGRTWHNLGAVFDGFRDMHIEIANVVIDYAGGEYTNVYSAYESLRAASKKYPDYRVKVVMRGQEIYLVRTDM